MEKKPETYEDLEVFQEAHRLTLEVYALARSFPPAERFRLNDQICRAAASAPANIAEGFGRYGRADIVRFLHVARGSLEEARYFLLPAQDLGYPKREQAAQLRGRYTNVRRMPNGLIAYQRRAQAQTS